MMRGVLEPTGRSLGGETKSCQSRPPCELLWPVEVTHDSVGQCEVVGGLKMYKAGCDDGETARKKERASARVPKWGERDGGLMDPPEGNGATPDQIPEFCIRSFLFFLLLDLFWSS